MRDLPLLLAILGGMTLGVALTRPAAVVWALNSVQAAAPVDPVSATLQHAGAAQ